jgi:hypothetical protein
MTFEKFKHIVDLMVQNSARVDGSHELGIDLIEFTEGYNIVINYLWGQLLTTEGLDWFDWFMYEKNYLQDGIGNPEMRAFNKTYDPLTNDKIEIEIVKDLKGLYDYLLENNYFKCESPK